MKQYETNGCSPRSEEEVIFFLNLTAAYIWKILVVFNYGGKANEFEFQQGQHAERLLGTELLPFASSTSKKISWERIVERGKNQRTRKGERHIQTEIEKRGTD